MLRNVENYLNNKNDDIDVNSKNQAKNYFKIMKNIIDAFEIGIFPKIKVLAEPQLGKRNLYPEISKNIRRPAASPQYVRTLQVSNGYIQPIRGRLFGQAIVLHQFLPIRFCCHIYLPLENLFLMEN